MKLIIRVCCLLLAMPSFTATAQIKIGLPLGLADSSAVLDLSNAGGSFNKGFLLPQVNLTSTIVWGLLGTIVTNGMLIYNNATAGSGITAVIPGMYIWVAGKWTIVSPTTASTASFPYCNSTTFNPGPSTGVLYNGTAYSASYSLGYTAGSGAAYNSIVQSVSGLTLTRTAGNYATGGGNIIYNLSGTYTGLINGTVSFSIVECSNTVTYGTVGTADYIRSGLSNSLTAYDAAIAGNWVNITAAEYTNEQSIISSTSVLGISSSAINSSTPSAWGAGGWIVTNTTNMTLAANNYLYGVSFKTGPAPTSLAANTTNVGASTSSSGSYSSFPSGANMPAVSSFAAGTTLYFIFKKPSVTNSSTTYLGLFTNTADGIAWAASTNGSTQKGASSFSGTIPSVSGSGAFGGDQPNNNILVQFLSTPTKQW